MSDVPNTSLVNVNLDKAAEALVKETSRGVSGLIDLWRIPRLAKAEAEAARIRTHSEIEVEDLRRRAEYRRFEEDLLQQRNLDKIAEKAQLLLGEGISSESVDDDWFMNLRDKARLVSNDQMQLLWAKLITGEISSPGSFSKRTVNAVANMDQNDCQLFTALCAFEWSVGGEFVPLVFGRVNEPIYTDNGVSFGNVKHLEDIGLISFMGPGGSFTRESEEDITLSYFGEAAIRYRTPGMRLNIGRVMFTLIGAELARIAGAKPIPGFKEFALHRLGGGVGLEL